MNNKLEEDLIERKQKGLERFILLILGASGKKISLLHIEKESFLLWNFYKKLKDSLKFIPHLRGPFSREIQESVLDPVYSEGYWEYIHPKNEDKLSGGFVKLTPEGKREYEYLVEKIKEEEEVFHLLTGIEIVARLYGKLSLEELLLLIYDTYPEYIEKSKVYEDIWNKRKPLSAKLIKKGIIDKERYKSLLEGLLHE